MMSTHVTNLDLTETEFYHAELRVWGEEYVESLLERGYTPVLTSAGWRWLLVFNEVDGPDVKRYPQMVKAA